MPKLEVVYTDAGVEKTIKADDTCNEISKVFSVSVINSKIRRVIRVAGLA